MDKLFGEVDAVVGGEEGTQAEKIEAMAYSGGTRVHEEKEPVVSHAENTPRGISRLFWRIVDVTLI